MSVPSNLDSPFHAGERAIQNRMGVRDAVEPWARQGIRPFLPEQHRQFFAALPFVVAAARDTQRRPWATVLAGMPGFIGSPTNQVLSIDAMPTSGDALAEALREGDDIGLLGIELHTRRRNRANGRIERRRPGGLIVEVDQSFGNCPQYISERQWESASSTSPPTARRHLRLGPETRRQIERADTFFIATGHRAPGEDWAFGMDASHRGGPPGFVQVADDRTLLIPDYAGNNHFNTLGNLALDPRAGLVFVDFERGALLQLTGRVEIDWSPEAADQKEGIRRWLRFQIDEIVVLAGALPLRWRRPPADVFSLRVAERVQESDDVVSFLLESQSGAPLPEFVAGQHLPIEVDLPGERHSASRTYSLSNRPNEGRYRLTIKREPEGRVSRHLHDTLGAGVTLRARSPAGTFGLPEGDRPVVLMSAGVGLTPMVSMLHLLARQPARAAHFVHGARNGRAHPLAEEVRVLVDAHANLRLSVAYSVPQADDRQGHHFDRPGRVRVEDLVSAEEIADADFLLCGPAAFLAERVAELYAAGVPETRIHVETFGPAGSPGATRPDAT